MSVHSTVTDINKSVTVIPYMIGLGLGLEGPSLSFGLEGLGLSLGLCLQGPGFEPIIDICKTKMHLIFFTDQDNLSRSASILKFLVLFYKIITRAHYKIVGSSNHKDLSIFSSIIQSL